MSEAQSKTEDTVVDLSGRPLGSRALKKRRQLMDATVELLRQRSLRDLRVVDIAREVKTSPATFYQYFQDVEDVVLHLAEEATAKMPSMVKLFEGDWRGDEGLQKSRKVADAFIRYWDEHGAVLRVRNVAADEGDARFLALRSKATAPVLAAMSRHKERQQTDQLSKTHSKPSAIKPMAAAVAMGAILDRLSAYHKELESIGLNREDIVEAMAQILHKTLST